MIKYEVRSKNISQPINVIICQKELGSLINDQEKEEIKECKADFLCLPELFFLSKEIKDYDEAANYHNKYKEYIKNLSEELDINLIGGTLVLKDGNNLKSVCYIFSKKELLGEYIKVNLTDKERSDNFQSGDKYNYFWFKGIRFMVLICNDIFDERGFIWARQQNVKLIFMPTGSPYKPQETIKDKFERDERLYVSRAKLSNSIIIKVCGIGRVFNFPLQGRSLVASPEGILFRVKPEEEQQERLVNLRIIPGDML